MQTVSETYRTLMAEGAPKETEAIISESDGSLPVTYTHENIVSASISAAVESKPATVGNCVAKTLNLVLRNPGEVPRMAKIQMRFRLNNGTTQSEWIPKGTFFIDTRDEGNGLLTIVAYDAMLKCDQQFMQSGNQGGWPRRDLAVVNDICTRIGVTLDSRTRPLINAQYQIGYPGFGEGAYSIREVLGIIGGMYAGNWIITDQNTLRLLAYGDIPPETHYLVTEYGDAILIGGYRILV